jgi:hypothetical protein
MLIKASALKINTMAVAGQIGHHHHPLKKAPCDCAAQMMLPNNGSRNGPKPTIAK